MHVNFSLPAKRKQEHTGTTTSLCLGELTFFEDPYELQRVGKKPIAVEDNSGH
jgi:hypothetical protein